MILGVVERLALAPFALLEDSAEQRALAVGDGADALTTPEEMLGLDVSAILFCDGGEMVETVVAEGGVPPRMAMVGDGGEMVARNKPDPHGGSRSCRPCGDGRWRRGGVYGDCAEQDLTPCLPIPHVGNLTFPYSSDLHYQGTHQLKNNRLLGTRQQSFQPR